MSNEGRKLSQKQQRFIDAYIELGNATEAAKQAGYKCRSYSAYGAVGSENLKKLKDFILKNQDLIQHHLLSLHLRF